MCLWYVTGWTQKIVHFHKNMPTELLTSVHLVGCLWWFRLLCTCNSFKNAGTEFDWTNFPNINLTFIQDIFPVESTRNGEYTNTSKYHNFILMNNARIYAYTYLCIIRSMYMRLWEDDWPNTILEVTRIFRITEILLAIRMFLGACVCCQSRFPLRRHLVINARRPYAIDDDDDEDVKEIALNQIFVVKGTRNRYEGQIQNLKCLGNIGNSRICCRIES